MRFAVGLLGGAISGLVTALALALSGAVTQRGASEPFASLGSIVLANGPDGTAWTAAVTGLLTLVAAGSLLGGVYTSVICGRVATGPAVAVGVVYGFGVWVFFRLLLVPFLDPLASEKLACSAYLSTFLLYGGLMGVWVITASHIWPNLAFSCRED